MSLTTTSRAAAGPESLPGCLIDAKLRGRARGSTDRFRRASLDAIQKRLWELDRERDLDQALEANAATLAIVGVGLGVVSKKWLVLPAVMCGFLLQHALQGWCPAVPLLRALGYRTLSEIELEMEALRSIRQNFSRPTSGTRAPTVDETARPVSSGTRPPPTRGGGAAAR